MRSMRQIAGEASRNTDQRGFALEATLGILVLLSILVVTVYATAMAAFRSGTTDLGKQRTYYAAEAGAESGMSQLADALEDAVLEDGEMTAIVAPTMAGFSFDSFSVTKIDTVKHERITDGPFTGLYSLTQMVDVYSEASAPDGSSSAVVVTAKAQAIPIFQFGVFYEKDLEIHNGPPLTFAGWVHTNGNLYVSSNSTYYDDIVTTPNNIYHMRKDRHVTLNGVYIHDASATDVQLDFDSRSHPNFSDFRNMSNTRFDDRLKTNAYGVDTLKVPLPDGMDPVNVIERRLVADGALEIQSKMAHKADWYIEVPLNSMPNESDFCANYISIREAGKVLPTAAECAAIFDLDYDQWYEGREGRFVDVLNIEMDALFAWAGTDSTKITEIFYVFFSGTGPDPQGDGNYPVLRLEDAHQLGNPISVASRNPIYVRGNYNTVGWEPSAILGDNVTFLSDNWNDANQQVLVENAAVSTSVYAAIMSGHSETPCDHMDVGCGTTSPYGGGLENFPRFLENWSGRTLTYRGSLVSLYFPQMSTGAWGGHYYNPPGRDWAFDLRFNDPANLPPGTPVVGNVIHTAFRPVY